MKLPRLVAFDEQGKAICAGCAASHYTNTKVIHLPSDGPDFIKGDVRGKTEEELRAL